MNFEFSLYLKVFDPEQLRQAALAHEDAYPDVDFLDDDGNVDVSACLRMLLDPGSLPGCDIFDSAAEGA